MKKFAAALLVIVVGVVTAGCGEKIQMPEVVEEPGQEEGSLNAENSGRGEDFLNAEDLGPEEGFPDNYLIFEEGAYGFLGTVLEETSGYMVVEPAADQEERQITDRVIVQYPSEHDDYLYGTGRRVVIYYQGPFPAEPDYELVTEDISTEGFREFELSVLPAENMEKKLVLSSNEIESFESFPSGNKTNLYYYGISEVQIKVDGQTIPLAEAIEKGKITLNAIVARGVEDVRKGIVEEISYDDGGSAVFQYEDYTVIKYHTLDGNRDVYIGSTDMGIDAAKK